MTNGNNLHVLGFAFRFCRRALFDGVENTKSVEPQFPWSYGVGSKRFFLFVWTSASTFK
jgi:hypothetical protein